jgi:hypothetical protein
MWGNVINVDNVTMNVVNALECGILAIAPFSHFISHIPTFITFPHFLVKPLAGVT